MGSLFFVRKLSFFLKEHRNCNKVDRKSHLCLPLNFMTHKEVVKKRYKDQYKHQEVNEEDINQHIYF